MNPSTIQAKSLSTLTALAFNPPSYPPRQTSVRNEPLVLYIARVPGSKDVFLSPLKPRDKVVSAEDITSSLYFVHVDQPEDVNLVTTPDFQEPDYSDPRQTHLNPSSAAPVQRKPVPANSGDSNAPRLPMRKPVPGALAPVDNYGSMQNTNAGNYAQRPGMLDPNQNPRRSFDSTQYQQENARSPTALRRSSEGHGPLRASLTLIRRDPSSGTQWNVAHIEDPQVFDVSSSNSNDSAARMKFGNPMYVEVFNPGYSKFLNSDTTGKPPLPNRPTDMSLQPGTSSQPFIPESGTVGPSEFEKTFRRRLWMEGAQSSNGGFGHRKNSSYDASTGRPNSGGGYNAQGQPSPSFLTHENQSYSTIQVSDRQTGFRGYVFNSPWNSRCEFVTGGGGGSLKCRHIIPGTQGTLPSVIQVSELRFNLPGSSKPAGSRGEDSTKRPSIFHRGRHSRDKSSGLFNRDSNYERHHDDRLDLSLGQEYAGGGFGGKHAKLGKIILQDEGLQMMDLLVAANLGLWWRAYERATAT